MPFLRGADGGFVTDDLLTVFAKQAVHVDVVFSDTLDPLDKGVDHEGLAVQITSLDELDLGVARCNLIGLVIDTANQDAGEQKVRKHDDALEAEARRAFQHRIDPRVSNAAIADFHPTDAGPLPEHARQLADIAVGIRVRGAPADHRKERVLRKDILFSSGQRFIDTNLGGLQQLRIDAEIAAELDLDAVFVGILVEHRGHVVLDVAGGKQHARDR